MNFETKSGFVDDLIIFDNFFNQNISLLEYGILHITLWL